MKLIKFIYVRCFWFNKFKNNFIINGKKQKIENVFIKIFIELKLKYNTLPLLSFYELIEKFKSPIILCPFRRGTKVYILPVYIKPIKQYKNSIYWLVKDLKKNSKISIKLTLLSKFEEYLTFKTINIYIDETINQKTQNYRLAAENRTHLHFRW